MKKKILPFKKFFFIKNFFSAWIFFKIKFSKIFKNDIKQTKDFLESFEKHLSPDFNPVNFPFSSIVDVEDSLNLFTKLFSNIFK